MSETLFENTEINLMRSYYDKVQQGIYLKDNPDLSTRRSNDNYNSFIEEVITLQPKEFFQKDFRRIDQVEMISFEIIMQIFGYSKEISDEIMEYFSKCNISNDNSILSGICLSVSNTKTQEKETIVEIPSADNLSSIISIIHEFIHYHIDKFHIDLNKKYYYEEILSIYAEKFATDYLMKLRIQPDLEKKIEQTRLEGIKWHYDENPQDEKELMAMYRGALLTSKFNPAAREFVMRVETNIPWLKSQKDAIAHDLYRTALAQSYGFGYLYGESLLYYDLNDPKARKKIREV